MEATIRLADRLVVQVGTGLAAGEGQAVEPLDAAAWERLGAALAQPNGGVMLSADHAAATALPVPGPTQEEQDRTAARSLVVTTAAGAVGVRFDALTTTQLRSLLAIVLWQGGALDASGVVKPLAQWVRSP